VTLPLLHADSNLLVVDKPAGSVVHPTRGAAGALVVVRALEKQLGSPVFPVHRLDRQTSGVLMVARTREAARTLCTAFRNGMVDKAYLGLCRGIIAHPRQVDHAIDDEGTERPAVTDIEPVEHFCGRYTLFRAWPRTGRRHQIRSHLRHINHPLVVDVTYGNGALNRFFRTNFDLKRLFLHAESLRVPLEPEPVGVTAPLPQDLTAVLARLRSYSGPVV
jgi:RluA family pseudouridine synthase